MKATMESRLLNFKFDGDLENFGLHVDDSVNVPNDQGNVVISTSSRICDH